MIVLHIDITSLDQSVIDSLEEVTYVNISDIDDVMDYLDKNDVSLLLVGEEILYISGLEALDLLNNSSHNRIPTVFIVDTEDNYHFEHYSFLGVNDCFVRNSITTNTIQKYLKKGKTQKELYKDMQNLSVAIIDDSKVSLAVIQSILKNENINNIKLFNDPRGLLKDFENFDVFFVDVVMPGITGDKLVGMIRRMSPNSIIITMSTVDNVQTISNVLGAGSDDYIIKPFNKIELLARLRTNYRSFVLLKELEKKNIELDRLSKIDSLTGAYNHGHIFNIIKKELTSALHSGLPLCLLLIDLDLFKLVNDRYGHGIGDEVLMSLSKLFIDKSRINDHFGRYGGEEFLFVMTNTSLDKAVVLSECLLGLFSSSAVNGMDSAATFSGGLVMWDGSETNSQLIKRADDILYIAKKQGRNRILT